MENSVLSLKWNNHVVSLLNTLSNVFNKDCFSDATVACDGKFYSVHRLVLSCCSDYFKDILEKIKCKHPVIVLSGVSPKDLELLLNYMYLGEVNVFQDDLTDLIKAAESLKIKGLAVADDDTVISKKSLDTLYSEELPFSKKQKADTHVNKEHSVANYETRGQTKDGIARNETFAKRTRENAPEKQQALQSSPSLHINEVSTALRKKIKTEANFDNCEGISSLNSTNIPADNEDSAIDNQHEENFPVDGRLNWTQPATLLNEGEGNGDYSAVTLGHAYNTQESKRNSEFETSPYSDTVYFQQRDLTMTPNKFGCKICGRLFPFKSGLKAHLLIHSGEKPFQCNKCDYRATQKGNLKSHVHRQHQEFM